MPRSMLIVKGEKFMTRGISKGSGRTFMLRSLIVILAISMMVMFTPTIAFAADDTAAQTSTQTTSEATPEAAATTASPTTTTASGTEAASDAGTKTDTEGSTAEVTDPVENTESAATQDVTYAKTEKEAAKGSDMSYNIGENASGTQTINFGNDYVGVWSRYGSLEPGDSFKANIGIMNSSKHTYQIDANSLNASTIELEDSQKIATIPNNALIELFGKDGSSFTLKDLSSEGIAAQLKAKNFNGDLNDYYLQYYNKKYKTSATTLYDLPLAARDDIMGSGNQTYSNGIYQVSAAKKAELEKDTNNTYRFTDNKDGTWDVQAVSNDSRLTDMKYLHLLSQCLQLDITGSDWTAFQQTLSNGSNVQNSLTEYLSNSTVYQSAVDYLAKINGGDINKASSDAAYVFTVFSGLNGPNTGNSFMNYAFGWNMSVQAKQIDGSVTITKKTSDSGSAKATFKLYYKVVNDKDGSESLKYYKVDKDGNITWVDDANDATAIETSTASSTTINYLMPSYQYYLQEMTAEATDGNSSKYDVYNDLIAFKVGSNSTTSVTVTDTVHTDPTPVVPTPDPITPDDPVPDDPTPVTPVTPDKPTPATPSKPDNTVTTTSTTPADQSPTTGDDWNGGMMAALMLLGASGMISMLALRRKETEK